MKGFSQKEKRYMIISDPSSSYQKNPRKYPNAHMLQPNSFILINVFF